MTPPNLVQTFSTTTSIFLHRSWMSSINSSNNIINNSIPFCFLAAKTIKIKISIWIHDTICVNWLIATWNIMNKYLLSFVTRTVETTHDTTFNVILQLRDFFLKSTTKVSVVGWIAYIKSITLSVTAYHKLSNSQKLVIKLFRMPNIRVFLLDNSFFFHFLENLW